LALPEVHEIMIKGCLPRFATGTGSRRADNPMNGKRFTGLAILLACALLA
jgi:hypothetical protein